MLNKNYQNHNYLLNNLNNVKVYIYFYFIGHIFIQILLKENLPTAVLNTLKHDNDPFVRSKALECLEKMVSILDIWESVLKESNLIVIIVYTI